MISLLLAARWYSNATRPLRYFIRHGRYRTLYPIEGMEPIVYLIFDHDSVNLLVLSYIYEQDSIALDEQFDHDSVAHVNRD